MRALTIVSIRHKHQVLHVGFLFVTLRLVNHRQSAYEEPGNLYVSLACALYDLVRIQTPQ